MCQAKHSVYFINYLPLKNWWADSYHGRRRLLPDQFLQGGCWSSRWPGSMHHPQWMVIIQLSSCNTYCKLPKGLLGERVRKCSTFPSGPRSLTCSLRRVILYLRSNSVLMHIKKQCVQFGGVVQDCIISNLLHCFAPVEVDPLSLSSMVWNRGPQHPLLGTGPHSRRWVAG